MIKMKFDFNSLDVINIGCEKKLNELLSWRDKNENLVRNAKSFINEGVIHVYSNQYLYFKVDDKDESLIYFSIFYKLESAPREILVFNSIFRDGMVEVIEHLECYPSGYEQLDYETHSLMESSITIFSSLMAFVTNYEEFAYKKSTSVAELPSKKSGNKKKKSKVKKTKLIKTKYILSDIEETIKNTQKREYHRESLKWSRRGHKRVYRDKITGEIKRVVWIKPHVCKAKNTDSSKAIVEARQYQL